MSILGEFTLFLLREKTSDLYALPDVHTIAYCFIKLMNVACYIPQDILMVWFSAPLNSWSLYLVFVNHGAFYLRVLVISCSP